MIYRDAQGSLRALYALAVTQGGFFTAKQAATTGYDYSHLTYHLQAGNFKRAGHGLYRLSTIPPAEHDDLIRLSLWSRNRQDEPQAVVSHASALLLHQLGDILPQHIHLTVPTSFRKRPPRGCILHRAQVDAKDIEFREGFLVTTPLRTLMDVAAEPGSTDEQLSRAVDDALRRGMVRESQLRKAIAGTVSAARLERLAAPMGG